MGVVTHTEEFTSTIAAPRMFKALILESDTLIPKIAPQAIKSVEILEGDGGPGTIKKTIFGEASQIKYVKHRVDALDKENLTYSYSLIEGDTLLEKMESITSEVKFEANPEGGCKGKNTSIYTTKPGVEINEEEIKGGKAKAAALFKLVEGYLLANPEACA